MEDKDFLSLSNRVVGALDAARRAARRASSGSEWAAKFEGERVQERMDVARSLIEGSERSGALGKEQAGLLWSRLWLVEAYVSYTEGNDEPLAWQDWLKTDDGQSMLLKFPQRELQKVRRTVAADLATRRAADTAAREAAWQPRREKGGSAQSSHIVSQAALGDLNEDPLRNLCRLIKQAHGVEWSDKRPKGGTLKIAYMAATGPVAEELRASGFSFSPSAGWWRK